MNPIVLRTGMPLPKALQAELATRGASYTSGQCDDPTRDARTSYHLFHPGPAFSGTVTVLFHGTGNDALFCWEYLILDLLKTGRAVFTFDLPGHGRSSSTILHEASFARAGSFLPRLLPELLPALKEVEAVGYSLGALAALQQVSEAAMPWRALVLMAVPERVELSAAFLVDEALSFFQKTWWRQVRGFGWDASFPAFGPVRRARFPIRLDPDIRMSYPAFVDGIFKNRNVKEELKNLLLPILLLYGTRDSLATATYGQSLGKRCELIQGANHFLLPLAEETRKRLVGWLISRQRPAAS
ncbi:MAG TPA: alpha/beta fold hydrolase [Oligoflexus sp.]|uniref:alpha/beta hydrolase n=1 Tax=Oligoflexus sp. TaxID=1971216 RepID=UPI002D80CAA3|nr:alpha/beta fold hydrolase [Oligoflexus sp.]HET9239773.1 alpha/beta fold hydrolase [Oligoflexus sp.]